MNDSLTNKYQTITGELMFNTPKYLGCSLLAKLTAFYVVPFVIFALEYFGSSPCSYAAYSVPAYLILNFALQFWLNSTLSEKASFFVSWGAHKNKLAFCGCGVVHERSHSWNSIVPRLLHNAWILCRQVIIHFL